jgi:hypothetical protein
MSCRWSFAASINVGRAASAGGLSVTKLDRLRQEIVRMIGGLTAPCVGDMDIGLVPVDTPRTTAQLCEIHCGLDPAVMWALRDDAHAASARY